MTATSVAAVVVAGGSGERLGREGGKQLAVVAGLPVLSWTVAAFADTPEVDLIVVVCPSGACRRVPCDRGRAAELATPVLFVPGGESRQASVSAGLAALPDSVDVVVVHDGARPLVTPALVAEALEALRAEPIGCGRGGRPPRRRHAQDSSSTATVVSDPRSVAVLGGSDAADLSGCRLSGRPTRGDRGRVPRH